MTSRRRLRWTLALLALGVALAHLALLSLEAGRDRPAAVAAAAAPVMLAAVVEPAAEPTVTPAATAAQLASPPTEAVEKAVEAAPPKPVRPPAKPHREAAEPPAPQAAPDPAPAQASIERVAEEGPAPPPDGFAPDEAMPRLMPVAAGPMGPQASAALEAALAAPPPVYRTRIPPAAKVAYRLSRSGFTGSGTLDWKPQGGSYTLRLDGKVALVGTLITQTSRGGFDSAGLAPQRFTDKRLSKAEQAANFQRARGQISFSGPKWELPILAGTQDRLSVMVQLAAVAGAWARPPATGEEVHIYVVGARGDGDVWTVRYLGREAVRTADGGVVDSHKFLREPTSPHGTRAEFWLDPDQGFLPVRARLTDGSGDALELLRDTGAS